MALYPSDPAGNPVSRPLLSKSYQRVGIRRDRNLGDLSNSARGLENLLDSLVDDGDESFVVEDLNAIKNVFSRGLDIGNYQNVIGSSVKITVPNGDTVQYDPRITYQNRIDKFEIFSGNPRFAGGDGLTANYYQNDQVNFNSLTSFPYNNFSTGNPLDPNLPESNIFLPTTSEGQIPDDKFWEHGEFRYTGKIHPQSVKANTGVKWEGYYIPRKTGTVTFQASSTGFYTFDFSREDYFEDNNGDQTSASEDVQIAAGIGIGQTYKNHARVGLTTTIAATGSVGNEITIAVNKVPNVGIGMSVSGSNINSTGGTPIVQDINHNNGVITLTPVEGQTNSVTGTLNNDVTFNRHFGTQVSSRFTTHVLIAYEKYRMRVRYFHPQIEDGNTVLDDQIRNLNKQITIHHRPPFNNIIDNLDFKYLYSLNYDFRDSVKGGFNRYLDQSVLFGGTVLGEGIGTRNNANEYIRLKTSNKVDLKYQVKESLAKITKVNSRSGTLTNGSKIVAMSITSSIEIGNYVFGTNIPDGARVDDIQINSYLILSKEATGSGAQNLKFIDHRGFVKKVTGAHSGLTISGITPALFDQTSRDNNTGYQTIDTDVQVGMVAIGEKLNSFSEIKSITSTNSMQISRNVTSTGTADIYIYQSRGLKDNSIQNFCDRFRATTDGPRIKCLISEVSSTQPTGIGTVKVENLNGVAQGWELQGAYFGENGIRVDSVSSSDNVITLDGVTTRPLPTGARFTAVSNETISLQEGDYQLCCPPTDTSPPFDAAEEGLNTTSTYPDFKLVGGNLIFDSLIIQDTNSNAADIQSGDAMNVNRKIEIKTPLSTSTRKFEILATT